MKEVKRGRGGKNEGNEEIKKLKLKKKKKETFESPLVHRLLSLLY